MGTLKIDRGDNMEVLADSFVWLRNDKHTTGDLYFELCDLSTADRDSILNIRNKIVSLTEDLDDYLLTLSLPGKIT